MPSSTIRTEIRGLDLSLDEALLTLSRPDQGILAAVALTPDDAERLRLEMAKVALPEWNQLEEAKTRANARYRRYLASWLMMCVAAFSAYISFPEYFLCVFFSLLSLFLWWRAGYMERRAEREAQAARNAFRPSWAYLQERSQEDDGTQSSPSVQ